MTKKQALRLSTFLLLVVLMISGLIWLLRDRETTLSSLYSEPKNTVDVFMVGSSHVNSAYIPGVLWQDYNISAHNVFSWSQPMWISYHYIIEGLRTQQPSVVVLDLNGMLYGNSAEAPEATDQVNYLNSFSIAPGWNLLRMTKTVETCGIDLRTATDFLPLIHYHTRWKTLDKHAFTYNPYNDPSYLKGYGFQVRIDPLTAPNYPATNERSAPYETAVAYLDKIVALSEKENFELIFVLAPYTYQQNEPAIFNWLEDYSAERGIPFYNYCTTDGDRIGIDWATDFCDARHVNYLGALKLTHDLGSLLLQGEYDLRTRAELANAAALDADAGKMDRTIDLWTAIQNEPEDFIRWVNTTGGTLAIAASGDCTTLPDSVWQTLEATGFDQISILQQLGSSYAAVLERGMIQQTADPSGSKIDCQSSIAGLQVRSQGGITLGTELIFEDTNYAASSSGLHLLYYDTVLQRVVYHITIDSTGNFVYTDVGSTDSST